MREIEESIGRLEGKGWTLAAIADELGAHWFTVQRWKKGTQEPNNAKAVLLLLAALEKKRLIPKQRRYAPGTRKGRVSKPPATP